MGEDLLHGFHSSVGNDTGNSQSLHIKTSDEILNGISLSFMSDLGRREGREVD